MQKLDADFQTQSSDGQVQVLLTSCHTAAATDATGEVRGGDRQSGLERGETGSSQFMSAPFSLNISQTERGKM